MKFDTIVWDLDGTLSDSAPGIMASVRYALDKMGRDIPPDAVLRSFVGPPLAASFARHCHMSVQEAEQASAFYSEDHLGGRWKSSRLYPGIFRLLSALKKQGAFLAVATGKPTDTAEMVLSYFGILGLFDKVVGTPRNSHTSRKKEAILAAIAGRGNAVMVGDRAMDAAGAEEAGIPCIAAAYGYADPGELERIAPFARVHSVDELYGALGVLPAERKGYFISVEGNDGCGKSTQIQLLAERIEKLGLSVVRTREPGGCPISEQVRAILLDKKNASMFDITEAMLFAAARAQHVREVIAPALEQGHVVLCDRFVDSSVAYQGAGQQLGEDLIQAINAPAVDRWMPDTTVYLDIDYLTAMKRRAKASEADRIELYGDAFHLRAQQSFRRLCAENPQRFLRVDALGTPEEVHQRVFGGVAARLKSAL